jgi:hypothetical protein
MDPLVSISLFLIFFYPPFFDDATFGLVALYLTEGLS